MAELPDLGEHCAYKECKRLDYLPMRCAACKWSYCKEHLRYEEHNCPEAYLKNVVVPQCPLCNKPIPVPKGLAADYVMNEHINMNCEIKKKEKMFKNRCSKAGCKKKELIPVTCKDCKENFCLGHRHPQDHQCQGDDPRAKAATAAVSRDLIKLSLKDRNAQTSGDADLALAIQLSQEEEDRRLAQQLQDQINSGPSNHSGQSKCIIS